MRLLHGRMNCLIGYRRWGMGIDSEELGAEGELRVVLPVTRSSKGSGRGMACHRVSKD